MNERSRRHKETLVANENEDMQWDIMANKNTHTHTHTPKRCNNDIDGCIFDNDDEHEYYISQFPFIFLSSFFDFHLNTMLFLSSSHSSLSFENMSFTLRFALCSFSLFLCFYFFSSSHCLAPLLSSGTKFIPYSWVFGFGVILSLSHSFSQFFRTCISQNVCLNNKYFLMTISFIVTFILYICLDIKLELFNSGREGGNEQDRIS